MVYLVLWNWCPQYPCVEHVCGCKWISIRKICHHLIFALIFTGSSNQFNWFIRLLHFNFFLKRHPYYLPSKQYSQYSHVAIKVPGPPISISGRVILGKQRTKATNKLILRNQQKALVILAVPLLRHFIFFSFYIYTKFVI